MKKILIIIFFLSILVSHAQREANIWYFGQNAGLDFNSGSPIALTNGQLATDEGCATISNASGQLLFYTDGITVYNRNHTIMLNGTGLMGHPSSTQSATIVPKPGSSNLYYIFTTDNEHDPNGFRYSIVDMNLDNGIGAVTSDKNVLVYTPTIENLGITKHGNDQDYWIITHGWNSNNFISYQLTSTGLNLSPIITSIGQVITGGLNDFVAAGTIKISPSGSKLAFTSVSDIAQLFDFDNSTGVLNNPLKFTDPSGEFPWTPILIGMIIGATAGATGYIAHAIQTGDWSWGAFGLAVGGGALIGGITAGISPMSIFSAGSFGQLAISSFAAGFMPVISVPIGDWTISASPSIAFGNAAGAGVSFGVTYSDGDWSISGGFGIMEYTNYNGFGANAKEFRYSVLLNYDDGKTGFSLGTNFWEGDFKQRTGLIGFHNGDFRVMYENDGGIGIKHLGLGDRGDSYRTAALNLSVGDYSAGFNLMTGERSLDNQKQEEKIITGYKKNGKPKLSNPTYSPQLRDNFNRKSRYGYVNETGPKYRLGALSVGYKNYKIGVNSEHIRNAIQNRVIHGAIKDRGFENQSWNWNSYFQYKTPNTFTSW